MKRKDRYVLYDTKTWGSFKVKMVLGLIKNEEKEFIINPAVIDRRDIELQLNRYRMDYEPEFSISKMYCYVIVRDGGVRTAKTSGIKTNTVKIPIKRISNEEVEKYYSNLEQEVEQAMRTGKCRKCNNWESWDGKRCENYCEVADACKAMGE